MYLLKENLSIVWRIQQFEYRFESDYYLRLKVSYNPELIDSFRSVEIPPSNLPKIESRYFIFAVQIHNLVGL